MSRRDVQRLNDIAVAITAIRTHLKRGDLSDGLIFDAVRVRFIEIGEAVKALGTDSRTAISTPERTPPCAGWAAPDDGSRHEPGAQP